MKSKLYHLKQNQYFLIVLIFSLLSNSMFSSTSVPAGDVSGTWTLSSSPYLIEGDITVPAGQSLIIEPGVLVEFQNWYRLIINGDVQAVGTSSQQIVFTATPPGPGEPAWPGIDIMDGTADSHFEYCVVENGQSRGAAPNSTGAAFYILNSSPVIKYCTLRNNNSKTGGGAIYIDGGSPLIEGCTVTDNYSKYGGAIYSTNYATPVISGNIITNNSVSASGAFSPVTAYGGGIYLFRSDAVIKNNVISNNSVYATGNVGTNARGGAIYSNSSNPVITGNTIYNNDVTGALPEGGAIYINNGNIVTVNNIMWNNMPEQVSITSYGSGSVLFAYSDIEGGQTGILVDNSTVYWQEGNISSDPLFTDPAGEDYSLQSGSPAIDAGIAHYEWQGNVIVDLGSSEYTGSAPDMGAIEFGGSGGANQSPVAVASSSTDHGSSPLTIDFSSEGSYDPDGTIVSYQWDFGDGSTSSELNPTHTFTDIDQYSVRLIITDDDGATNTSTIVIEVQDGTTLTGGDVSGTWTLTGSPYRVEGDITVPAGASLTIEPGVTVDFIYGYKLTVNGTLQANGTESDPILFTSAAVTGWVGIYFIDAPDGSLLDHCILENGRSRGAAPYNAGGAIYMLNSSPAITNSILRNNQVSYYGGAIYCDNSGPVVSGNNIINNSARNGGAIYCTNNSQPLFTDNNISYNSASASGGFSPATSYGGGIYLYNSDAVFEKNIISYNTVYATGNIPSYARGGAIYTYGSNPRLIGNTIYGNDASGANPGGGAIYVNYSDVEAVNNILWNNTPLEVSLYSSASVMFAYSDVEGGEAGIEVDNGTVSWQEGNINSDPHFSDASADNFTLLSTSPCVNAGTDYFEWQGNVIVNYDASQYAEPAPDMGALESAFTQPVNQAPVANASATPLSGYAPLTVQFSSDASYDPDGNITSYLWTSGTLSTTAANPQYTFTVPGTYNISLEVTDNNGATDYDQLTIEVLDPVLAELHVSAQSVSRQRVWRFQRAVDRVQIVDQDNTPVDGVSVTASYYGPTSGTITGNTDSNGIVDLGSNYAWKPSGTWCFEVTDVSKDGYVYNPDNNVVTTQCEGSTGTFTLKSATIGDSSPTENVSANNEIPVVVFPNPVNGNSRILFALEESQKVTLKLYDVTGKTISVILDNSDLDAGSHEYRLFNGGTNTESLKTGIYYLRITNGEYSKTLKLIKN